MMETAARQLKVDPAELRRKNFITSFPYQTPVIMAYDIGDFGASLDAAMKAIDYAGFPARKAKAKSEGKLRGIGFSCYIEACGIAPSKAVGSLGAGVGLWESAEVRVNPVGTIEVLTGSHSHGQGHETTFCAAGRGAARRSDQPGPDRPRRHRQGAVRHGHLRLALDRGRRHRHHQGDGEGRGQGQEDRSASRWRRPRATSSSRTASSRSPAPTSRSRCRWSRSPPIPRTICPTAWSPA